MKTADLDFALKLAQPCITPIDLVPVMTHFCFNKESVFAYDEVSAIVVDLATNLNCALRGESLLPLVGLAGKDIKLEAEKDKVMIRSGKSVRTELPALPAESFIYEEPRAHDKSTMRFVLSVSFLDGLRLCAAAVGDNPHFRERTAVTLTTGKKPKMYAWDGTALVKYRVIKALGNSERTILIPKSICDQILSIKDKIKVAAKDIHVALSKDHMLVEFGDHGVRLVGNLLEATTAVEAFETEVENAGKIKAFDLPKGFDKAVDRTLVVLQADPEPHCRLVVGGNQLAVIGEGAFGNTETTLQIEASHVIATEVDPKRLTQYREQVARIGVGRERIVLYDATGRLTYIIACWGTAVEDEEDKLGSVPRRVRRHGRLLSRGWVKKEKEEKSDE